MRKKFIFLGIVIILGVCFVIGYSYFFSKVGKDMKCTELFHEGEYSAVEGAEIDITGDVIKKPGKKDVWESKILLGEEIEKETKFTRNVNSVQEEFVESYMCTHPFGDITYLTSKNLYGYNVDNPVYCNIKEGEKKLNPAYEKVMSLIEQKLKDPHSGCFETHKLKDLMEYYPFGNGMLLADKNKNGELVYYNSESGYTLDTYTSEEEEHLIKFFEENFKIPVPEDIEVSFYLKSPESKELDIEYEQDSDQYWVNSYSTQTEENFYFTFDTHTQKDQIVDTSKLAYGYGIYRVPFELKNSKSTVPINVDKMKNIYPLDLNIKVVDLKYDGNDSLCLVYSENGRSWYSVIDIESNKCKQKILLDNCALDFGCKIKAFDGFNLVDDGYKYIYFLQRNNNGEFKAPLRWNRYYGSLNPDFSVESADFDGKRLILAGQSEKGFKVTVYDRSGTVFYGGYKTDIEVREVKVKWIER